MKGRAFEGLGISCELSKDFRTDKRALPRAANALPLQVTHDSRKWHFPFAVARSINQRDFEKALLLLQKIGTDIPDAGKNMNLRILQARCHAGLGNTGKAESILEEFRNKPEAESVLAEVYVKTGKTEKALDIYKKSLDQSFSFFVLRNYLRLLAATGKRQEAMDTLRSVRATRSSAEQQPFLAELYFMLQEWPETEKILSGLIQTRPWEAKWYVQLASVYQVQNQNSRALMLLQENYSRFSGNPDYLLRLGILYKIGGQPVQEIDSFKEMIRSNPMDSRGYFYLAKSMLDQNQNPNTVFQLLKRGFQSGPDFSMQIFGHYILSEAYQKTGKKEEAEKEFQIAQKLENSGR